MEQVTEKQANYINILIEEAHNVIDNPSNYELVLKDGFFKVLKTRVGEDKFWDMSRQEKAELFNAEVVPFVHNWLNGIDVNGLSKSDASTLIEALKAFKLGNLQAIWS